MRAFNYRKTVQALNYIATKYNGTVNKMKAIKLIWLSDRLHLRTYGRTITGDSYFAFKLGPVPSAARDFLGNTPFLSDEEAQYGNEYLSTDTGKLYSSKVNPNMKVFSQTDVNVIDQVIAEYGMFDQFQLSDISHDFPEWIKWKNALEQNKGTRFPIDLEDFFKDTDKEKPLFKEELSNLQVVKNLYLKVE